MKLIRFGEMNKEKPGICINDINYDVSDFIYDYDAALSVGVPTNRNK